MVARSLHLGPPQLACLSACRSEPDHAFVRALAQLLRPHPETLAQRRYEALRVRSLEGAADPAVRNGRIGHDEMFAVVAVEFVRDLGKRFTLKRQQSRR